MSCAGERSTHIFQLQNSRMGGNGRLHEIVVLSHTCCFVNQSTNDGSWLANMCTSVYMFTLSITIHLCCLLFWLPSSLFLL